MTKATTERRQETDRVALEIIKAQTETRRQRGSARRAELCNRPRKQTDS